MTRFTARLVAAMSCVICGLVSAADETPNPQILAQDLDSVRASGFLSGATWTRRADRYTLQLIYPRSALRQTTAESAAVQAGANQGERIDSGTFFIGETIARLRGMDPSFGDRTLTLIDGRRSPSSPAVSQGPPEAGRAMPAGVTVTRQLDKMPEIQVWLLRSDGTQILPIARSAAPGDGNSCTGLCIADEINFRFPHPESGEAVAAAIRVGDDFYIEKLRPF